MDEEEMEDNRKVVAVMDEKSNVTIEAHKDWHDSKGLKDNDEASGRVIIYTRSRKDKFNLEEHNRHTLALSKITWGAFVKSVDKMFEEMSDDMV